MRIVKLIKQLGQLVVVEGIALAGSRAIAAVHGNLALTLVGGLATAIVALLAYTGMVRLTERRPVTELGLRGAPAELGCGTLIGLLLFAAVIGTIAVAGGYHVLGLGSGPAMVGVGGVMAAAAVTEELAFRGVLFRIVEERAGTVVALAGSSLLFGAMHLINPDATLWGAVAIAIEAGGMLGAAYIATRKLWLAIGLHLGWNFAESGIFGTEVSGAGASQGLLHGATSGPTLLTGGGFGPEASLVAVLGCTLVTAALLVVAQRRGNLVRFLPQRRRTTAGIERGSAALRPAQDTASLSR